MSNQLGHRTKDTKPSKSHKGSDADINASRRALAGVLGAFGIAALSGCSEAGPEGADAVGKLAEALVGNGTVKVAISAADLRTITGGTTLWVAVLEGIAAAADGGGGVFYWSTTAQADDGWAVLNASSGNTAGWRRANPGFVSANTVTALRALQGGSGRSIAILTDYATSGDGGGGLFVWSTTAAPDNGGTILNQASGNSAGWRRVYSGPLDIRWFGASTSGTASGNAAAIQSAINTALPVYVPAGTFLFNATLNLASDALGRGAWLSGGGPSSILKFTGTAAPAIQRTTATADGGIRGLNLLTSGAGNTAIALTNAWDYTIENVVITQDGGAAWNTGILLANNGGLNNGFLTISGCNVAFCATDGIRLSPTGSFGDVGIAIENNHIAGNGRYGIYVAPTASDGTAQVHIFGNDLESNGSGGIYADGLRDSTIAGNAWDASGTVTPITLGLTYQFHGVAIKNNILQNTGSSSTSCLIDVGGVTFANSGLVIEGNTFNCPNVPPASSGAIRLGPHTSVSILANVKESTSGLVPLYYLTGGTPSGLMVQDHAVVFRSGLAQNIHSGITSTTYSIVDTDDVLIYEGTANSVFTLPTQSALPGIGAVPLQIGRQFTIKNWSNNTVTVKSGGTGNIDGSTGGWLLAGLNKYVVVTYAGTRFGSTVWAVIGNN